MKNSDRDSAQLEWICNVQSTILCAEKTEAELAADKIAADAAAKKADDDKAAADKALADKALADKAAADKVIADKAAAEAATLPKTLEAAIAEIKELRTKGGLVPKWAQDRIDTITGNWRGTEREVAALKTQLEQLKAEGKTVPTINREEVVKEAQALAAETAFNEACIKVLTAGRKDNPDLDKEVQQLHNISPFLIKGQNGATVPNMPRPFIEAVLELDAPALVLAELAKPANNDEAARMMALPPSKQGVALAKFAQAKQIGETQVSRVVPPADTTVGGRSRSAPRLEDDKMSTADWMELRNKQLAEKRKRA